MREITQETVIAIHDMILAKERGDLRIISEGNLYQMVFRANLTDDPAARAAMVFYSLCAFPVFRQGNRRTARRIAEMILASGGYQVDLPCEDLHALVQGIDAFTIEIEDVEQFLHAHARRSC